jgi:hypothetical protein
MLIRDALRRMTTFVFDDFASDAVEPVVGLLGSRELKSFQGWVY